MPHTALEPREFRRRLLAWYRRRRRDLPWRRTRDPYAIWLSEIMLQQTRVETVIPYFERFRAAFPTLSRLARAPLDRVLHLWSGLGYYRRARNLHAAAKIVMEKCVGELPRTAAALADLPGIGRYTAAAIASIAFGERAAVVDGNVERVLARLLAIRKPIDESATRKRLWIEADRLLAPRSPGDHNQAMMELGATICTPRNPACHACPVSAQCQARRFGTERRLPVRTQKKASPVVHAVAAALVRDGRLLLVRRPLDGLLAGLWTLPGGELAGEREPRTALEGSVGLQIGAAIKADEQLGIVRHEFSHRSLVLTIYSVKLTRDARLDTPPANRVRWMRLRGATRLPLATVDRKCIRLVRGYLAKNEIAG